MSHCPGAEKVTSSLVPVRFISSSPKNILTPIPNGVVSRSLVMCALAVERRTTTLSGVMLKKSWAKVGSMSALGSKLARTPKPLL